MALIALAVRLGGGAAKRDRDCVKARHSPCRSFSTTHFSSTANTILFVSGHYPHVLNHYRQTPSGGLDWSLSPPTRLELQIPVDVASKTKCSITVLTHTLSLEEGTNNFLPLADYHRQAVLAQQQDDVWLLNEIHSTCLFIPIDIQNRW